MSVTHPWNKKKRGPSIYPPVRFSVDYGRYATIDGDVFPVLLYRYLLDDIQYEESTVEDEDWYEAFAQHIRDQERVILANDRAINGPKKYALKNWRFKALYRVTHVRIRANTLMLALGEKVTPLQQIPSLLDGRLNSID
jgi:hypothetical protein